MLDRDLARLYGFAKGGIENYGVQGVAYGNSSADTNYGVYGISAGSGSVGAFNTGVYGEAKGSPFYNRGIDGRTNGVGQHNEGIFAQSIIENQQSEINDLKEQNKLLIERLNSIEKKVDKLVD